MSLSQANFWFCRLQAILQLKNTIGARITRGPSHLADFGVIHCLSSLPNQLCAQKKPSLKSDVTGGDYLPTTASLSATSVACTACSTAVASGNDAENPGFSCENHEWTVQSQAATACPRFQAAGPRQPAHWPKRQEVYIEYGKAANQRQNEVYPGVSEIQT